MTGALTACLTDCTLLVTGRGGTGRRNRRGTRGVIACIALLWVVYAVLLAAYGLRRLCAYDGNLLTLGAGARRFSWSLRCVAALLVKMLTVMLIMLTMGCLD